MIYTRDRALGRVEVEMLFRIDAAKDLQRRPDVAFVSYERWPRDRKVPSTADWDVVPDLAIEVVSPTNLAGALATKIADYFRAGVGLVWVIHPNLCQVQVWESPSAARVLTAPEALEGGAVLLGFRLPLADLFEGN